MPREEVPAPRCRFGGVGGRGRDFDNQLSGAAAPQICPKEIQFESGVLACGALVTKGRDPLRATGPDGGTLYWNTDAGVRAMTAMTSRTSTAATGVWTWQTVQHR